MCSIDYSEYSWKVSALVSLLVSSKAWAYIQKSLLCYFHTAQLHPLWGRECLTSHPRRKTGQASRVIAKGASFTFGRLRQYSPGQLILLKQRPHLADRALIFPRPGSSGASGGFSKGEQARNLGCRAHHWARIPELNFWKAHYSRLGRKWHWGVEEVNKSWRQSVHHNCCGAFRHITTGTNGDQEWDHMTHQSQHHSVLLQRWHLYHNNVKFWVCRVTCFCFLFLAVSINQFKKVFFKSINNLH